ncbi:DUF6221 family protein [Streptomyces sp. NPDC127110]|uniref:DUF6221 family protein n=1 Tax=Streptomyces sp. NPDC127110 TaxID=3345362 RepID=UPI00363A0029
MNDLVQFLRARLDEDAADAHACTGPRWRVEPDDGVNGPHIARHDPARVLAEVLAKRLLLNASNVFCAPGCGVEHSFSGSCGLRWMGPVHEAHGQRWVRDDTGARFAAPAVTSEWTLRVLALPYANHPGYQQEWQLSA